MARIHTESTSNSYTEVHQIGESTYTLSIEGLNTDREAYTVRAIREYNSGRRDLLALSNMPRGEAADTYFEIKQALDAEANVNPIPALINF